VLFANDTISFVILGFVMFMFIKSYNKLKKEEVVKQHLQLKFVVIVQWKFQLLQKNVDIVEIQRYKTKKLKG
jgi:large-conductance mechanosensitive channel